MFSSRILLLLLLGLFTLAASSDATQKNCHDCESSRGKTNVFGKIRNLLKCCLPPARKNCNCNKVSSGFKGNTRTVYDYKSTSIQLWKSESSWNTVNEFLRDIRESDDIGTSKQQMSITRNQGLTVNYRAKVAGSKGGVAFYAHPKYSQYAKLRSMTLTYEVKFPSGFDFNEVGILPGLWGNHEGITGKPRHDETNCGSGNHKDCWSVRLMWNTNDRKKGTAAAYMYAPHSAGEQAYCRENCCDKKWGDVIGRNFELRTGKWNHLAITVGTNGVLQVFHDRKLVISYNNIRFGNADRFAGIKWETYFKKGKGAQHIKAQKVHFRNFALYGSTSAISI